jgi:hypothetical protein
MPARTSTAEASRHRRLILAQAVSGLSHEEFCRREGISVHAFRFWKYRRRRLPVSPAAPPAPPAPRLVPVRLVGAAEGAIEVLLAGGRSVRVRAGFDEGTLRRVIAVLETPAC